MSEREQHSHDMDPIKMIDRAEAEAAKLTEPSLNPEARCRRSNQPSSPASPKAVSETGALTAAQGASGCDIAGTGENSGDERMSFEQSRREKKKRENQARERRGNWLMSDTQGWVGRKVRSRRNFAVYTISEVFKNGRVKLERNWMTYLTDAETVRTQYDTCC